MPALRSTGTRLSCGAALLQAAGVGQQQATEVGRRLVAAVLKRVGQLTVFPDSGRIVPEFDTPWLRELEMSPYRIVYRRDDAVVTVVRVWRSERMMDPDLEGRA
ncbi:MAG: type II toxin-antitoxin system RelE/ParE family toxin [Actinobacteria bacterium]|nr:type II toxin-antitoxin system RelE/ParE family toxin [Actinomycetota bacterium]